jgi:hydrogenase maturation protein HypF
MIRKKILITGQVQGVGFRPAVYRLARQLNLTGFVYNDARGVTIELQGEQTRITEFINRLLSQNAPPLAKITSCRAIDLKPVEQEQEFVIEQSDARRKASLRREPSLSGTGGGTPISRVTADIATCADCLVELFNKEGRSRDYVPTPVYIKQGSPVDVFAAGSDLKNTFCFIKGNQLICSEHIGDLEDAKVYHHYIKSIEHLRKLFEVRPKVVACDLHPSYLSSQYAHSLTDVKLIEVQHHWAHIASVIAEYSIGEPVIGLACDGTGYGTDGAIWGCECLVATLDDFERFGHLAYYPLAGGDAASKEPIRPLLGLLMQVYGNDLDLNSMQWLFEKIEPEKSKQEIICEQIRKNINTVQTSSLGRVFDAVAAMLGLGNYNHFEAQLPVALESIASPNCDQQYDFELSEQTILDLRPMIKQIVNDIREDKDRGIISAKFHNTLAVALGGTAKRAREGTKVNIVALSGGVFCNRFLTNRLIQLLKKDEFSVLLNRDFPANDGCISVGQAAIASHIKHNS